MRFHTNTAVIVAANSAEPSERAAILSLNTEPIVEARIGLVLKRLIQLWIAAKSPIDPANPTLRPILILESVRLAEAINQLEPLLPEAKAEILLLPSLTQATLEAGTMTINNLDLQRMEHAVDLLKARQNPMQGIREAQELVNGLAFDCAGPLGAVYGVTVP